MNENQTPQPEQQPQPQSATPPPVSPSQPQIPAETPQQPQPQLPEQISVDNNNLLAALCYGLFPPLAVAISIFLYIQKKDSDLIQFHAKQGMIVGFIFIIAMIIPYVGPILAYGIFPAIAIISGYKAYQGEKWEIPVVSEISKQINL